MYTAASYEQEFPLAFEYPDSIGVGTHTSAYVSMETYHRAKLIGLVGDLGQGATVDIQILQAQDAAGTGAKVIVDKAGTGTKAITQLTQAGGDGDDGVVIELQTEELDVDNGFDFIAVQVVIAGAAVEMGYVLFGCEARYKAVGVTGWTEVID